MVLDYAVGQSVANPDSGHILQDGTVWHCAILLDLTSGPGFTTAVNCVIVQERIQEHVKNALRSLSGPG